MEKAFEQVVDFHNSTTPKQHIYFLQLLARRITVPVNRGKGVEVMQLDNDVPVCMNGIFYQINVEDWKEYSEYGKEIH